MSDRYARNRHTLSTDDQKTLAASCVAVIGCGGLGGFCIEYLGRLGMGTIIAVDGDVFEESNLNRQLLSRTGTLGMNKAYAAAERMKECNPEINLIARPMHLDTDNAEQLLQGAQLVLDAVDSIPARFMIQSCAEKMNIPMIHAAVAGWYGQLSVIYPGDAGLNKIYGKDCSTTQGMEKKLGNLSFTPAALAALQCAEAIKILLKKGPVMRHKLLLLDMLEQEIDSIPLLKEIHA